MKNNLQLCKWCADNVGQLYWYGTFGQPASKGLYHQKKAQYPKQYLWNFSNKMIGKKVFDCVGLIKSFLWYDEKTKTIKYDKKTDVSAEGIKKFCESVQPISKFPKNGNNAKGFLVFKKNHVGVYIGDGYVVEAKGHNYGVVKTVFSKGGWQSFGRLNLINYLQVENIKFNDDKITKIARQVINGDFGNGKTRKKKLKEHGYNYKVVQKRVNEILKKERKQ